MQVQFLDRAIYAGVHPVNKTAREPEMARMRPVQEAVFQGPSEDLMCLVKHKHTECGSDAQN